MRTIIAGSRDINSYVLVCRAVRESGFDVSKVLSGAARGVDKQGERWALRRDIPLETFPAN